MKIVAYLIVFLVSVSLFFACDNDDDFSTDSSLRLSFSRDTVQFDTVFTSFGTATKRLKVYNKNKNALTIGSVELLNSAKTGFRMNVDGESGDKISNVNILGEDSLFVFVEVTVDPLNRNNPVLISDSIRFQFNGVTQYVRLEAIGQDVIFWKGKTINENTTLTGEKPYLIYDSLYVKNGVTLNLEKNVYMYFHKNATLSVAGRVNAVGTIDEPVVLRGDRTDNLFENPKVAYDRVHGQWGGVKIASGSYNNHFENVRIRNGVYGVLFQPSDTTQLKASFLNTIIQNTSKEAILSVDCKIDAENSLFANSGSSTVRLVGGSYNFLHCTMANYMHQYWGLSPKNALQLSNEDVDAGGRLVTKAVGTCCVINSIVYGNHMVDLQLNNNGSLPFRYQFINCLLKATKSDDANYVNTVWNTDPLFKFIYTSLEDLTNANNRFYYSFELSQGSPAINKASRQYAVDLPDDIRGVSRRSDEAPDIGCYEWK